MPQFEEAGHLLEPKQKSVFCLGTDVWRTLSVSTNTPSEESLITLLLEFTLLLLPHLQTVALQYKYKTVQFLLSLSSVK